jgi:hypothetical protein
MCDMEYFNFGAPLENPDDLQISVRMTLRPCLPVVHTYSEYIPLIAAFAISTPLFAVRSSSYIYV